MHLKRKVAGLLYASLLSLTVSALAQDNAVNTGSAGGQTASGARLAHYILGPNDEVIILSVHATEIANKPVRITTSGELSLPMVGRIHAAGMTLEELEAEVTARLKTYILEPDVAINVTQFKSQPVSVFGSVGAPGVLQLEGRKTLIEVLSMAGGLRPDAGSRIKITRRKEWGPIPLASSIQEGEYSVAEVNIRSIEDATHPEENIAVLPNDVITVGRGQVVYVMGDVRKPGGFALSDRNTISILEVIARAEGLGPTAKAKDAKVIRPVPGANRIEIAVNVQDVLRGKSNDIMLQPDDILFVPPSYAKGTFRRSLETAIQLATGMIIYH